MGQRETKLIFIKKLILFHKNRLQMVLRKMSKHFFFE